MKYLLAIALVAAVFLQTEAKRCHSEEDCDAGECCLRRGLFGFRKGDCTKLAQLDESCSMKEEVASFFDTVYVYNCPCDAGLTCEPSEYKNLPFLGTVGVNEKCVVGATAEPETEEPETEEPETEEPETEAPETEEPAAEE